MALNSSADQPAPVREISAAIGGWIHRLGAVWVEGQVAQLNRRPGANTLFMTLRDPSAEVSLQVSISREVLDAVSPPIVDGARVIVHARPRFYFTRGSLSLAASEIRPIGVGDLLARLERLKTVLMAEGLFDAERKRPLPFLPRSVGLICGRGSAAEHDVLENARQRWPAVIFHIENVPVQGVAAVPAVTRALQNLQRNPDIDVVVISRGGGSTEDLLPFSDESLVREVARCRIPVVSAIGHETDTPLLDLVADVRASTPTDAARRIVPDLGQLIAALDQTRRRIRTAAQSRLASEQASLAALVSRPALASPVDALVTPRRVATLAYRDRARRHLTTAIAHEQRDLAHQRARVLALSPGSTLARGYALVHNEAGALVRDPSDVGSGEQLRIRLAHGELQAVASGLAHTQPASNPDGANGDLG